MVDIFLASSNPHKRREIRDILSDHGGIEWLSPCDFPQYKAPEEDGATFEENAYLKAQNAIKHHNMWIIAEDSGLVVPKLGGKPGVLSARFAGHQASHLGNRKKLLRLMESLEDEQRSAFFECCAVLVGPDGIHTVEKGRCEGMIVKEERGSNGFGYDAIFQPLGYRQTFAQLSEATKNRVSHRNKCFRKLSSHIRSRILTSGARPF